MMTVVMVFMWAVAPRFRMVLRETTHKLRHFHWLLTAGRVSGSETYEAVTALHCLVSAASALVHACLPSAIVQLGALESKHHDALRGECMPHGASGASVHRRTKHRNTGYRCRLWPFKIVRMSFCVICGHLHRLE